MLSPEYLQHIADELESDFAELEKEILSDIARRIRQNDFKNTSTASHQKKQLEALGISNLEIQKKLSELLKVSEEKVSEIMEEAVYQTVDIDNNMAKEAGIHFDSKKSILHTSILQGIKNLNAELENICKSTVRTSANVLTQAMNKAYLQIQSGAFSYDYVVDNVVKDLAKQELGMIEYKSGVHRQLDTAIRTAVRTSVTQTAAKAQEKNLDELGVNLVQTTSHLGARPSHASWQGQIFYRKSKVKGYQNFSVTGYGSGAGLCGWNCRHSFYPYFEGLSSDTYQKYNVKENKERYELEQTQRYNERQIREWKRRRDVCKAGKVDSTKENRKVREWTAKQKQLLKEHPEIKRNYAREKGYAKKALLKRDSLKEKMTKQLSNLTKDEVDIIKAMSGALSQKINYAIGHNVDLSKYADKIKLIDSAIKKGSIPTNMTVIRKTSHEFLLGGRTPVEQLLEWKNIFKLIPIYQSTSLIDFNYPGRDVIISMNLPKGLNALYLRNIAYSQFKYQEEVLLGKNLVSYIKDVRLEGKNVLIEMDVIGYEKK